MRCFEGARFFQIYLRRGRDSLRCSPAAPVPLLETSGSRSGLRGRQRFVHEWARATARCETSVRLLVHLIGVAPHRPVLGLRPARFLPPQIPCSAPDPVLRCVRAALFLAREGRAVPVVLLPSTRRNGSCPPDSTAAITATPAIAVARIVKPSTLPILARRCGDPAPYCVAAVAPRYLAPAALREPSTRIDGAELLKRVHDVDALACQCGGRLNFIALILDDEPASAILDSLHLSAGAPPIARARSLDWADPIPSKGASRLRRFQLSRASTPAIATLQ